MLDWTRTGEEKCATHWTSGSFTASAVSPAGLFNALIFIVQQPEEGETNHNLGHLEFLQTICNQCCLHRSDPVIESNQGNYGCMSVLPVVKRTACPVNHLS